MPQGQVVSLPEVVSLSPRGPFEGRGEDSLTMREVPRRLVLPNGSTVSPKRTASVVATAEHMNVDAQHLVNVICLFGPQILPCSPVSVALPEVDLPRTPGLRAYNRYDDLSDVEVAAAALMHSSGKSVSQTEEGRFLKRRIADVWQGREHEICSVLRREKVSKPQVKIEAMISLAKKYSESGYVLA